MYTHMHAHMHTHTHTTTHTHFAAMHMPAPAQTHLISVVQQGSVVTELLMYMTCMSTCALRTCKCSTQGVAVNPRLRVGGGGGGGSWRSVGCDVFVWMRVYGAEGG